MTIAQQVRTVVVFTKLGTRRFFRDRLAIFFGVLFPLGLLVVFGLLGSNGKVSFSVALINESNSAYAKSFVGEIQKNSLFKIDENVKTISEAKATMTSSQIDGTIVLLPGFGSSQPGHNYPSGSVQILYDENSVSSGQTLTSLMQNIVGQINGKYVTVAQPFSVASKQLSAKSLTSFDYTFAGLLGFSIIGIGIFGPINVFPELKKQGILRRLHTTPLKVWQYFIATMLSQAITGIVSLGIQFFVAITVFHLKVDGNYLEIIPFTIFSIFMILGIGLAIGGWAKNERQAAPLSNVVVFPMLILSGTFFPRYVLPDWLQKVTSYLPLSPVIDGLRLLTTEGKSLLQIGPQIGLVAIWFVVVYAIAFAVFRWE